jgi:hypothetical protein
MAASERYPGEQVRANPPREPNFREPGSANGAREVPGPPVRLRALPYRLATIAGSRGSTGSPRSVQRTKAPSASTSRILRGVRSIVPPPHRRWPGSRPPRARARGDQTRSGARERSRARRQPSSARGGGLGRRVRRYGARRGPHRGQLLALPSEHRLPSRQQHLATHVPVLPSPKPLILQP